VVLIYDQCNLGDRKLEQQIMASPSYHVIKDYRTEIGIKYYFTSEGNLNI